jgi:GNAT superfamily N-acetyltransferase
MSSLFAGGEPDPNPRPATEDLAPGDERSAAFDWTGIDVEFVRGTADPLFPRAYSFLWEHFGGKGELEQQSVLAQRFGWDPSRPIKGYALLYEMIVLRSAGDIAAVRDHTAIVPVGGGVDEAAPAVVHLSHVLVAPPWRRTGLTGWLRAWPILTARDCLRRAGRATGAPVTLVAEMEPLDPEYDNRTVRLLAYERAGFTKVDPAHVDYRQPDFRPAAEIDAGGGPRPLPMTLIVRRVNREAEPTLPARELRDIVRALYSMYGASFRGTDMAPLFDQVERDYPAGNEAIRLIRPTE